jgi:hypothetical protein
VDIRYEINGQSFQFVASETDDLKDLINEIISYLRASHEELTNNLDLTVLVSNGVLNSIVDTDELDIGELALFTDSQPADAWEEHEEDELS